MDKMLFCNDGFGAIIISSTYENGQGTLIFDKSVTGGGQYRGQESLKSIVLPETVETSGDFYDCTGLCELYCKATTPPIAFDKFLSYYKGSGTQPYQPIGCIIYVPKESVELYKTAKYWSDYKNYIIGYDFNE